MYKGVEVRFAEFILMRSNYFISIGYRSVRIITGMDRNAPEWAAITGLDIKINLFYAP